MGVNLGCVEFAVEPAHEAGGRDGGGFGFPVEGVAHLLKQRDQRNVVIEIECNRAQTGGQVGVAVAGDVFVDKKFGIGPSELRPARPSPVLAAVVGENDEPFLVVFAD